MLCMDTLGLFSHCQILCEHYASQTVSCNFVIPLQMEVYSQKKKDNNTVGHVYNVCTIFSSKHTHTHKTYAQHIFSHTCKHATKHVILYAHKVKSKMHE